MSISSKFEVRSLKLAVQAQGKWLLLSLFGAMCQITLAQSEQQTLITHNSSLITKTTLIPKYESIGVRQGLSDNRVNTIVQDRRGFIWVGTANGLNRYDGYGFRHFFPQKGTPGCLPGANIGKLALDARGKLWVATNEGICRFDEKISQFDCFDTHRPDGDPRDAVIIDFFPAPDGRLWLISQAQRLLLLEPDTRMVRHIAVPAQALANASVLVQQQSDDVFDVWGTPDGQTLWIGGRSGVFRTTPDCRNFEYFPLQEVGVLGVQYVRQTDPGSIWVMVWQKGFYRLDLSTRKVLAVPHEAGKPFSYLFIEDRELWLGGPTGLARLNTTNGTLTKLPFGDLKYRNTTVTALFRDRNGLVWAGTENGLKKYDPYLQGFSFTPIPTPPGAAMHYANDTDDLLHSHRDGRYYTISALYSRISVMNEQGKWLYHHSTAPLGKPSALMQDTAGQIWVGCNADLALFDPLKRQLRSVAKIPFGDPHNRTIGLTQTADGQIWWATSRDGLYVHDPKAQVTRRLTVDGGFAPSRLSALLADRQGRYLWLTTESEGFWEYDLWEKSWRFYTDVQRDGLSSCHAMGQDLHGEVWISSDAGLLRYFPQNHRCEVVLNREKGLPENRLNGGFCDASGMIWWAAKDRLGRLDPLSKQFTLFDERFGVDQTAFGYHRFSQSARTGELYACADGGFLRWHPDSLKFNTALPQVVNTRLLINNREILPETDSVTRIGFVHYENSFTLEFSALNFTLPEDNQYQWKLEGSDREEWSTPSTDRFVRLNFLPPGRYTLLVKASNNSGVWNDRPLSVQIVVFPAWWQTWWFRTLLALLFAGLVYGVYYYRRRLRRRISAIQKHAAALEKQQLLSEIDLLKTQVNPHFLFNSLSILASLVRVDPDLSEQFIDQLSRSYRYILEQKDQTLVTLRTELEFIRAYIFLLKIRFDNKFDVTIDIPERLLDSAQIAPLTLQLLLENAVKHNRMSTKEPLVVSIEVQDNYLVISNAYRPRGNGGPTSTGVGLQNIINRYALLSNERVYAGEQNEMFVVRVPLVNRILE